MRVSLNRLHNWRGPTLAQGVPRVVRAVPNASYGNRFSQ